MTTYTSKYHGCYVCAVMTPSGWHAVIEDAWNETLGSATGATKEECVANARRRIDEILARPVAMDPDAALAELEALGRRRAARKKAGL